MSEHVEDVATRTLDRLKDLNRELELLRMQFSMLRKYSYTQGLVAIAGTLERCEESVGWLNESAPMVVRDVIAIVREKGEPE